MRYVFGTIGIIAALCFVSYAAVTSYHTAAAMTTQFPELAGWAAAGMVCWEALGALFVQQCWRNGSKWMAVGGAVLVLAASVYLLRIDLRFHVAGQSDMTAAREVNSENREMARSEHAKAVARRDELRALKTPSASDRAEIARQERRIGELEPRIWTADTVTAGGMPEAGWASRMLSGISKDKQVWTDLLMVVGLLFWALARMLALPVAVASMQMAAPSAKRREEDEAVENHAKLMLRLKEEQAAAKVDPLPKLSLAPQKATEARGEAFSKPAITQPLELKQPPAAILDDLLPTPEPTTPDPADVAAMKAALDKLDTAKKNPSLVAPELILGLDYSPTPPKGGNKAPGPQLVVDNEAEDISRFFDVPTKEEAKGSRAKKKDVLKAKVIEGPVTDWLGDCCSMSPDPRVIGKSADAWDSYRMWCDLSGYEPVGRKKLSRIISAKLKVTSKGVRGPRNGNGAAWPGLLITMPQAKPLRARA